MSSFKDHFSGHAAKYAAHRPTYPEQLFAWLAGQADHHNLCWDCATGNGQAARVLAAYFDQVVATDASEEQIGNARPHPKVSFKVEPAEAPSLESGTVDLITVAQAAHWFDHDAFFEQVRRVARPGALLAIWGYGLTRIDPAVDRVVDHYYNNITGPYWPAERRYLDQGLKTLPFPFAELEPPHFEMCVHWDLQAFRAYLSTWSASMRYRAQHAGRDPLELIAKSLRSAWGSSKSAKDVHWPLYLRVGRVN